MEFVARNCRSPGEAFAGLAGGVTIHGISNGEWSMSDGVRTLLDWTGPADVIIATWTAAAADLRRQESLLRDGRMRSLRLLVDRSFETRQPRYCRIARQAFGDEAIRVWSAHAKFCLLRGREDVLYLTSANLNRNPRLENFTVTVGGVVPGEYLALVEELWSRQKPGEAFGAGQRRARWDTAAILARK